MNTQAVKSVLDNAKLYLFGNGACRCGACAGYTARSTGRDLNGIKVIAVDARIRAEAASLSVTLSCENCGKV